MHEFKLEDHVLIFSTLQNYNKYWKSTIKNRAGYIKFRVSQQNSYLLHSFLYPFLAQDITIRVRHGKIIICRHSSFPRQPDNPKHSHNICVEICVYTLKDISNSITKTHKP